MMAWGAYWAWLAAAAATILAGAVLSIALAMRYGVGSLPSTGTALATLALAWPMVALARRVRDASHTAPLRS